MLTLCNYISLVGTVHDDEPPVDGLEENKHCDSKFAALIYLNNVPAS